MNGYVLLIISQVMLGSVAVFARMANMPAEAIVFFRCLFGALSIGMFVFYFEDIRKYLKWNKTLVLLAATGGFMAANWYFFFKAVLTTTITSTILLYNLAPIFVVISAVLFLKETPTVRQVMCVLASFVGVAVILGENPISMSSQDFQGGLYAVLAAALYAQVTILGRFLKDIPAKVLTFFQTSVGAIAFAPVAMTSPSVETMSLTTLGILITMGIVHTSVPYLMYFKALKTVKATAAGILQYIYTLSTILFGLFMYQERITLALVLGGLTILVSSYIGLKYPGTRLFQLRMKSSQPKLKPAA